MGPLTQFRNPSYQLYSSQCNKKVGCFFGKLYWIFCQPKKILWRGDYQIIQVVYIADFKPKIIDLLCLIVSLHKRFRIWFFFVINYWAFRLLTKHLVFTHYEAEEVSTFTICTWLIWCARNKFHHEASCSNVNQIATQTPLLADEYKRFFCII